MSEYWGAMIALLAFASVFALWPVLRAVPPNLQDEEDHEADNISIFEQRQAELQAEVAAGNLSEQEYAAQEAELQRALLTDLQNAAAQPKFNTRGGYLLLAAALMIPVAAWFTYAELGASQGMQQRDNMMATRAIMQNAETLEQMVTELQTHLDANEDNPEGWFILANTYMQANNLEAGLHAFDMAKTYAPEGSPQKAAILGQYAQALFFVDGAFNERVNAAIAEAMKANPDDVSALSLLGIQAFEASNFTAAIQFWERALKNAGDGDGARSLQAGIANAKRQLTGDNGELVQGPSIEVAIRLATGLVVPNAPNAVLFVYAREAGQRMPLLAARLNPNDLPMTITLDNSMALQQGTDLANYDKLDVVAHIAKEGVPGQKAGDMVGQVLAVSITSEEVVDLAIDRILSGQE
jgi:cytochrome c-type biogenesis protein CcmH